MPPAALAVLLVAPALVLVRAPWPLVPVLSAAFWAALWPWTPWLGGTRSTLVGGMLAGALALALLRLLRFDGRFPGAAALLVAAAAVLPIFVLWPALPSAGGIPLPPGAAMPFHGAVAQLLTWRDGVPLTYEPLLSHPRFVPAFLGLPGLAADATLLGRGAPLAALATAALAGEGLLVLALYAGLARRLPALAAAGLAIALPSVGHLLGALPVAGSGPLALAAAFLVAAGALLAWAPTHGSAVAAALLGAAGMATEPFLALLALPWLLAAMWSRRERDERAAWVSRLRVLAAAGALAGFPQAGAVFRLAAVGSESQWLAALAVVGPMGLALLVVHRVTGERESAAAASRPRNAVLALIAAALVASISVVVDRRRMSEDMDVTPEDRAALATLPAAHAPGLPLCEAPRAVRLWAPAVAGAVTGEPALPDALEALAGPPRARGCTALPRALHTP